jgi:hypothetical protein
VSFVLCLRAAVGAERSCLGALGHGDRDGARSFVFPFAAPRDGWRAGARGTDRTPTIPAAPTATATTAKNRHTRKIPVVTLLAVLRISVTDSQCRQQAVIFGGGCDPLPPLPGDNAQPRRSNHDTEYVSDGFW